jgi:hypothetical protein
MNFCFWPNNPSGNFEYQNMTRNLESLLKSDPDFFTCPRLINTSEEFLREKVFDGNQSFCLMGERARIIREVAFVILNQYSSSFSNFLQAADFDCPTLVDLISQKFSGFRDEAIYNGEQVFFYKRA